MKTWREKIVRIQSCNEKVSEMIDEKIKIGTKDYCEWETKKRDYS